MNPHIPPLPNEAPKELTPEEHIETAPKDSANRAKPIVPPVAAKKEPEPPAPATPAEETPVEAAHPEPLPEAKPAPAVPRPAAARRPPAVPAPEPSRAAPLMPAMPVEGADDEEDDDEPLGDDLLAELMEGSGPSEGASEAAPEGVLKGVVVSVRDDGAFVDVGEKSEAFLPFPSSRHAKKPELQPGDSIEVTVSSRTPDGYLLLQGVGIERPSEFHQLEAAHAAGSTILGKVLEVVKGGLAVDVGARAFLPASRSGERDQESLEALVGQEVRCRIAQLDVDDRNVVLDRRSVLEEERDRLRREAVNELHEGSVVRGVVRSIRDFGAFIDVGGVDALLHVSDISWGRVDDVSAVLSVGEEIEVQVLRIGDDGRRIAVGRKQLETDPWSEIAANYAVGQRIEGVVTRLKDFGAFVQILPGAEGLIHVSEMSWAKRVRHPSDVLKPGDEVEAVILDLNVAKKRVSLGLKQALGDPWERFAKERSIGSAIEGVVRKNTNFGAFVEVDDGIEGLLHISDIVSDRRLNHPNEVIKVGDSVRVKILELNAEERRLKLGMKQLEPTEQDRYLDTVKEGDTVTGRIVKVRREEADVELGEGVKGVCRFDSNGGSSALPSGKEPASSADVSSLGERLQAAWKGGEGSQPADGPKLKQGELRSFRILRVDRDNSSIELALE